MKPDLPPPPSRSPQGSAGAVAPRSTPEAATGSAPAPRRGISLGLACGVLGTAGLLVATGTAYGLAALRWLDPDWAAAVAAGLGFLGAGLPLAWLAGGVVHRFTRGRAGSGPEPAQPLAFGMPRPLFMELASREWARARRYGSGAAMLLVDLDRPARTAEPGSSAEAVLQDLQRRVAPTLRPADLITRFGETRLAVFLVHADATGALDVAERIRERVERIAPAVAVREPSSNPPPLWTASLGVAHLRPAHQHLNALIDDAEDAVLAARQAGGNCVRAAPVEVGRLSSGSAWRGDERRARPKQGGTG